MAVTGGVAYWDGKIEAVRDAMLASWETASVDNERSADCPVPWDLAGVSDPGSVYGQWYLPKMLLVPVIAGLGTLLAASARKSVSGRRPAPGFMETFLTRTTQFTFTYAVASWARAKGYCQRAQQITNGDYKISIEPAAGSSEEEVAA